MLRFIGFIVVVGLVIYFTPKLIKLMRQKGIRGLLGNLSYLLPVLLPFFRMVKWRWLLEILRRFLTKP